MLCSFFFVRPPRPSSLSPWKPMPPQRTCASGSLGERCHHPGGAGIELGVLELAFEATLQTTATATMQREIFRRSLYWIQWLVQRELS